MTDADWPGKLEWRNVGQRKPHQGISRYRLGGGTLEKHFPMLFLSNFGIGVCVEVGTGVQRQREDGVGVAERRGVSGRLVTGIRPTVLDGNGVKMSDNVGKNCGRSRW